jgi:hypothetical protein
MRYQNPRIPSLRRTKVVVVVVVVVVVLTGGTGESITANHTYKGYMREA